MSQIAVRTVDPPKPSLGRHDWLSAALNLLAREGIEALQITRLSRKLNATRGSFYWHFKDREDLLTSLMEEWQAANSGIIAQTLDAADTLAEGVLSLFYIWVHDEQFSRHLDQAIRDWARHDAAIGAVVKSEEANRIAAIARFFRRHGYNEDDSLVRARVIYFTQVGYYALDIEESMTARLNLVGAYYRTFTGQELDPDLAAAHRRRMEQGGKS